ncbi:hypothetical protein RBE51_18540 [Pseudomonas taiwanensis]|uniref:hypothetical protein n=1 Tax=Pseudomonas taiwanensis TaxID=470150 RepID=UPI0028DF0B95|nr:hypothetical protein [Pseudomonas taiwanensis]MDT8924792.1 hypothetical protein [Pseudomonas taiwanensis]
MTESVYALIVLVLSIGLGYLVFRVKRSKPADARAIALGVSAGAGVAILAFFLWVGVLENIAARKWGGTMTISLPAGARLMNMTWKEDSVWYLYHDPVSGNCYFKEDSRHGLIEGGVVVKSCNPVGLEK